MAQRSKKLQYSIQNQIMTGNHHPKRAEKGLTGRWTKSEHDRFIKGFEKYGKKWTEVQKVVKTRSLTQVRSHAQKVFLNSGSNGLNLSMESQNSDEISYRDSSEDECSLQDGVKFQNSLKKQAKLSQQKNQALQKDKIETNCLLKEKENQLTKQQQCRLSNSFQLPQKSLLEKYLVEIKNPSHFMVMLTENYDYLNTGGNIIELCLHEDEKSHSSKQPSIL